MVNQFKKYLLLLILTLVTYQFSYGQAKFRDDDIVSVPKVPRLVNDFAGMLSEQEVSLLETKLNNYNDTTSTQIAIVTVTTIGNYPVEEYGIRLARKWGIGNKEKDNGILILIAKDERKFDIETGYRVGQYVSDIDANRILREIVTPNFKDGNYYAGLDEATDKMILLLNGGFLPDAESDSLPLGAIVIIIVMIIFFILMFSNKNDGNSTYTSTGHQRNIPPIWGGGFGGGLGGGGGFGGGSSGGGGFGGFGGGGFGGGGASGGW
ncbi:MAG TPA: TPM domain-containing protein [Chitinophagales bacterium]|nr:TPM domain-containing protein [Chitinophagales bacterium]